MEELIGRYYIRNGAVEPIESAPKDIAACKNALYEVIRVIERTPLFIEVHIARLCRSARKSGRRFAVPTAEIKRLAARLIEENAISSSSIKMVYRDDPDPAGEMLLFYFIGSRYPDENMYRDGLSVGLLTGERHNPTVKRDDMPVRKAADDVLKEGVYYEMLLVNSDGYVTEGSRSNVFFIREDIVYTPPDRDVLAGITKKKLVGICKREGIPVRRRRIHRDHLGDYEAAFLTGTPAKVAPIRFIDGVAFRADHLLLRSLMRSYDRLIEEYIRDYRVVPARRKR